jgi:hypothetical protein
MPMIKEKKYPFFPVEKFMSFLIIDTTSVRIPEMIIAPANG